MADHDMKQHHHAVIMAGGSGTRFWPASRRHMPKQLLPLAPDGEVLLTATVRRMSTTLDPGQVWIVSAERLKTATRQAAPELPEDHFLDEPCGRNTAPCVGWAAAEILARDPEAVLAVLPSDHHIQNEVQYAEVIHTALDAANNGSLVTVGIAPTRPETGYGYIEMGVARNKPVHEVVRFVEKPDRARAERYLDSGKFLWNSGMFFFRADAILERIRVLLPDLGAALDAFLSGYSTDATAARNALIEDYASLPSISIDHGVMEKADNIAVVPGDFGWSDLGSWLSAWELGTKDESGNVISDEVLAIDSRASLVHAPGGKLVALLGVDNLVVVDTEDALLVTTKDRSQDVRKIVESLQATNKLPRT